MPHRSAPYSTNRLFEWTMALTLLALGIHLFIWPTSIEASKLRLLLDVIPQGCIGYLCCSVGLMRAGSLIANGSSRVTGPMLRSVGSVCGAAIWVSMGLALALLHPDLTNPPSPSLPVYSGLFFAELCSAFRAAADARRRSR